MVPAIKPISVKRKDHSQFVVWNTEEILLKQKATQSMPNDIMTSHFWMNELNERIWMNQTYFLSLVLVLGLVENFI